MTRRKKSPQSSPGGALIGAILVIIAAIIFAVTGIDLTGGAFTQPTAAVTDVRTAAPSERLTNTPRPPTVTPAAPGTPLPLVTAPASMGVTPIPLSNALGFQSGFWRVYFTVPVGTNDRSQWRGGMEDVMAEAINSATRTLDIAAYEWRSQKMTDAVLAALARGVQVRMVVDNDHALNDPNTTLGPLEAAGVPIVDDGRSAFMHNKFIIIDGLTVWTGSMNYQPNDFFRNNNNVVMLRSRQAAQVFTAEFNEMFVDRQFGVRSSTSNVGNFTQDGVQIEILFAPENDVMARIIQEVNRAQRSIRFAVFSFTDHDLAVAMLNRKEQAAVGVSGVFETTGSLTQSSELTFLYCAGVPVFQDGNPGILHHKFIVIDGETVITGSFNFSSNAARNNDENLLIIRSADIAALYLDEWTRVRSIARLPTRVSCE
jgi:phosphatidylserine/phosphatidylglycerophosphate/cardiolipin synthase-like enzyme